MAGYEQTIIVGNVGRDVETKNVNGNYLASFSVAVTTTWNDKQTNERREKVNWYSVSCWGRLAEVASQYVRKGAQIMVVGTTEARAYLGQDNAPRASLDLRAQNFQLLGKRDDNEANDAPSPANGGDIPF